MFDYITSFYIKQYFFVCWFLELLDSWAIQSLPLLSWHGRELRTYRLHKKNALKTAEMSGKRAKIRHFSYIKQNSIAEIVSTMELFLVAEMGFEPHDLRVMSPTSCQTAPLRDIMVPEAGVEPVREKISRDFKSRASANSAIPAYATVCSYTLLNYYSTMHTKCQVLFIKISKKFSKNIDKRFKMWYYI